MAQFLDRAMEIAAFATIRLVCITLLLIVYPAGADWRGYQHGITLSKGTNLKIHLDNKL